MKIINNRADLSPAVRICYLLQAISSMCKPSFPRCAKKANTLFVFMLAQPEGVVQLSPSLSSFNVYICTSPLLGFALSFLYIDCLSNPFAFKIGHLGWRGVNSSL